MSTSAPEFNPCAKAATAAADAPEGASVTQASLDNLTRDRFIRALTGVFEAANLIQCYPSASAWCDEQGAANLEEVSEELDSLAASLALKPLERKRLEKALASAPAAAGAPLSSNSTAATAAASTEVQRIDPDDGKLCTLQELLVKYASVYSPPEIEAYFRDDCKPKPRSRKY